MAGVPPYVRCLCRNIYGVALDVPDIFLVL